MADKLGIGTDVKKLRLGESFMKNGQSSFHTLRYDFKPASMDISKVATVDIGQGNQVTVTVPHIEGSGQTVFKGSKKPYTKECVLIIDHVTGEITLERLKSNIQVKKTRAEGSSKVQQVRPITPVDHNAQRKASPAEKQSPTQKNWSSPTQKMSPYQLSPPQRNTSPPPPPPPRKKTSSMKHSNSKHRSEQKIKVPPPTIINKDVSMPMLSTPSDNGFNGKEDASNEVGVLTDSSSGSSSSGSSSSSDQSDSESENEMEPGN
uniref:Ell-associated factor Eaf n=1 Tax=Strigamia maritima TaxID=126957 RepID=T1JM59_STRMM